MNIREIVETFEKAGRIDLLEEIAQVAIGQCDAQRDYSDETEELAQEMDEMLESLRSAETEAANPVGWARCDAEQILSNADQLAELVDDDFHHWVTFEISVYAYRLEKKHLGAA